MPMAVQIFSKETCYVMALKPTSYSAQSIAVEYVIVQLTTLRMQESNAMVCMFILHNMHINISLSDIVAKTDGITNFIISCVSLKHVWVGVGMLEHTYSV